MKEDAILAEMDQLTASFWTDLKEGYTKEPERMRAEVLNLYVQTRLASTPNFSIISVAQLGIIMVMQRFLEWDIEARDEVKSK